MLYAVAAHSRSALPPSVMTSAREAGAVTARARDLHRKLLERVLLRSDTQNVKDVFRRYDRERAGVLTVDQFRALVRDHDFLDADTELLLRYLGAKDQQSVSFHAFVGDVQLGAEQNYPSKNATSTSPKKVQQLSQLTEKKTTQPQVKSKAKAGAKKPAVEMVPDPMEAIRTKLRERVMGHSKSIREVFMEYDTDGSGFLDYEEFGRFMAKYKFAPDETQTIVDYLDRDASGTIDYDEFAAGLLFYRPPIPAALTQAAISPAKSSEKTSPPKQQIQTQSTRTARPTKQPDLQQILDSIRSKFDESMKRSKQRTGRARDLKAEFDNYDVDGSNSLDHQEFGALLVGLGIKLKAQELRIVLEEVDPEDEERIDLETIANLLGVQEAAQKGNKGLAEGQRRQNPVSRENNVALVAFNKYDRDGSGELEYEEFRRLIHESGVKDDKEIDALIEEIDEDGSGSISFNEFARVYERRIKRSPNTSDEIAVAFSKYDRDGSGDLDYEEFRRLMSELGVKDKSAVDALIDEIDEDGSGSISFDEFSRVYDRRIKPSANMDGEVIAAFKKYDRDGSGELDYEEFRRMMYESGVKDSEVIDPLIDEIDRDRSDTISFNEFARVYDRKIKPSLKSTREQTSERYKGTSSAANTRPTQTMRKVSQAENEQSIKARLGTLQEQELQFMERVLRRHNSIENAFLEFDREGRNEMDFEQFRDFMGQYGLTDEANISMLLKRLDADNSGMIDLQEFLSVFNEQRLARHRGGAKTIARSDQRQNGVGQRATKRGVRSGTVRNLNEAPNASKTNKAARLRELEEKWIRSALAGYDSLQAAFAAFDRDQNGELTRDEFRKLMNQFGIREEEDITSLMKKLDADGNGCIEYEEFATIFHEARVNKDQETRQNFAAVAPRRNAVAKPVVSTVESKNARGARLRDLQAKWMKRVLSCHDSIETAFYQYDEDGNGELDHEEFRHFMKRYGIVKNDDIDPLIRRLDTDGSGTISFEEFSVIFNPLRVMNPGSTAEGISAMVAATPEEIFDEEELESILEIERELAQRMAHQTRDLRLAFRKFDSNGNGLLEYKEFRSVLKSYRLPEMEIRKVIRHLDRDVSGFIDYKEFIAGFGSFKDSGAVAGSPTQKKAGKRASPGKGYSKPKTHYRRSPAKPQAQSKIPSLEALKKTMLERILAIHGTVQGAFREYDLDKEGCLNEAQFVKLVLDCRFSRDEAARLLDVFDQDQSGTVEYQEFLAQLVVKGNS
ncbi:hypothetical protein PF005_g9585 [Phytophthora fragariae]|uniref:EF-hand domain-containing protein n=2 Tax=Phytophthora fragariae TaxID=53985 RepID=A0A6A4DSC4_9STRA|nr:hypothetical protein PF005_g9585 [Phytophthora fragariae]KAE9313462.1 hypothetical protein PF001_g8737 [Phytophthora fragariae]